MKRQFKFLWMAVLVVIPACGSQICMAGTVVNLRCENRVSPVGMDALKPRLSWNLLDSRRAVQQAAYQILVASKPSLLKQNRGDLWDSGRVSSNQCIAVIYRGSPFTSERPYWWKVRVWAVSGAGSGIVQPTAWSEPASLLTGKLRTEDWHGKWIGADLVRNKNQREDSLIPKPIYQHGAIYLRKQFKLAKPAVRAVLSFSGLGFSEVAIGGRKVGNYVIGPGFTDYDHRVPYLTFDVTDRFTTPGQKRLDVTLADGWYGLSVDPWVHQLEQKPYVDMPKLRLDLRLFHADGTETLVTSDTSWQWSTGEITKSWIAQEDIDLRKASEAARKWQPVVVVPAPIGRLQHQKEPFNHIVERFRPAVMSYDAKTGTASYDVGREVSGWVRLKTKGQAGTTIRITTIPSDPSFPRTSTFVLAGSGTKETYEPRFFYAGMQQLKIIGLQEKPDPDDVMICRISSMATPAGTFRSSEEYVNWLEQAVRRTVTNYTTFLPNDPVREWKAWAQDIEGMFGSMFYLYAESQTMYERWQNDLLDSQRADGNIANVAPGPVFDPYNSPWWGGCAVWLPWEWRLVYGDDSLLRASYTGMTRYVDFLSGEATKSGGLQTWGLADWYPVEETPLPIINTPAHAYYARIVGMTASLMGNNRDASRYRDVSRQVANRFNQAFLDTSTGIYGEKGWQIRNGGWAVPGGVESLHDVWWNGDRVCTEAGQVLPLALGLVPMAEQAKVKVALLREVQAHRGRLSTGFVSTSYLFDVMTDLDPEACWRLATTHEFPSWYSMTKGSGNDVMKETWAGGMALMPALGGSIARWCYRDLGGIRPDPDGPGFRKVIIRPMVVSELQWVECSHDSPYGRIISNWRKHDGKLIMDITLPSGTTGKVYIPTASTASILEGGKPATKSAGVKLYATSSKETIYLVGSGHYTFAVPIETR